MHRIAILLLILGLAGCSTQVTNPASPYFLIPAGSKIILKRELTIPPNAGRVYIQYGKVVSSKEKDDYHAHCWFESWDVLDHSQIIKPDTFAITKSQHLEDVVSRQSPLLYAALNVGAGSEGGGPMALVYTTHMTIHSDTQPAIRQFACSHWEDPLDAKHLTVAQMQKALGNIAEIQLNK